MAGGGELVVRSWPWPCSPGIILAGLLIYMAVIWECLIRCRWEVGGWLGKETSNLMIFFPLAAGGEC